MVTAHSSALPNNVNADMWAQSGYGQFGPYDGFGTGITLFDQWTFRCKATLTCAGQVASTGFIGGAVEGTNYAYTSKWVPSASTIHIYLHGDEFDELNYDPTGVWASAWQAQFFGETKETQSDVVGTQGDSANLTNLSKSDQTGTFSYLASNNASITENTRYHANAYAINDAPAVAVWTSPLH